MAATATAVKTTQQVADRFFSLTREGKYEEAARELYAPNVVSNEPEGGPAPARTAGHANVVGKTVQFNKDIESVHSNEVSKPIVADNHFAVSMKMDVTTKSAGRITMEEIAVYQVENGKIVRDQFFYRPVPMPGHN
jgi:hypothetical protein